MEIQVHPTGWETTPEIQRYPLSLLGHIMPQIYLLIAEVYALPANVDREEIIRSMTIGLEFSLSQFPVLAGNLETDPGNGQLLVATRRESTVSLHVKKMLGKGEFPSYDELEAKDFPASLISESKLLPKSVAVEQLQSSAVASKNAAATFQLNFIKGGFILGLAVHHALTDGPGCDGFITTWAQNSMAAVKGTPFIPTQQGFSICGPPLEVEKPTAEQTAAFDTTYPLFRDADGLTPPPPAEFKIPCLVPQMWHFPKSKVEALKARVSSQVHSGWISTYDVVLALLWSGVTRAKLDWLKPDLDSEAILVHAVNTRKLWDPPVPAGFLGVGATLTRTTPIALRELMAPGSLSKIATSIRSSINELTPQFLTGLLQWIASREDRQRIEVKTNNFLGINFGATSWQGLKCYEKHDFGFGLPSALRWPSPSTDGFVFLYPSRASMKDAAADEGIEVCVCLEKGSQTRLMEDEVLLEYGQPRGL